MCHRIHDGSYSSTLQRSFYNKHTCDRVCIKGPLVGRYETKISAVKLNWSILVSFREIRQSGSLSHKEAVDSYFKLISKLKVEKSVFFRANKRSTCRTLIWRSGTGYFNIIKQIMKCLFNEIHNYE